MSENEFDIDQISAHTIDSISTVDSPQLFTLMKDSNILNMIHEYLIKSISNKLELDFLKDKKNIKYFTMGICLFIASSLIGLMIYFLFYMMFFFSSLKCILWLFEHYNPTMSNENVKYSDNVLEYYIVSIFITSIVYPLVLIPIPMASTIVYFISMLLGLVTMTNKLYRQKFCLFIRDLFTTSKCRNINGNYVPGHEGEIHKLLQILCHSIEYINLSIFNIIHNPKTMYDKLTNYQSTEIKIRSNDDTDTNDNINDSTTVSDDNSANVSKINQKKKQNINKFKKSVQNSHNTHNTHNTHNAHVVNKNKQTNSSINTSTNFIEDELDEY